MNLFFITFANHRTGLGHRFRTEALILAAQEAGHRVAVGGDYPPNTRHWFRTNELDNDFYNVIQELNPDWLVIDLPFDAPEMFFAGPWQTCLINGVGHNLDCHRADVVIRQDFEGEHCAPDYVILRPDLPERNGPGLHWLVHGGGSDELELVNTFAKYCPDWLAKLIPGVFTVNGRHPDTPLLNQAATSYLYQMMHSCRAGCVHAGMIVWEMAALGIPAYVFSRTPGHLAITQEMERRGWIKAWPRVGLPESNDFIKFLETRFIPVGQRPDKRGAERVIRLLEKKIAKP